MENLNHEDMPVLEPGAGAAALEALRRFPAPTPPPAGDWPFTSLHWQNRVVRWWYDEAAPLLVERPAPPARSEATRRTQPHWRPDGGP